MRRFSPGERIVFLPYEETTFRKTQDWVHERGIFPERPPSLDYAGSVAVMTRAFITRHPEEAARSAALEGRRCAVVP